MKDLNKLFNECKAELDSIGIQYGNIVSIEVNYRAWKRYGHCRVVKRAKNWEDNLYSINISSFLLAGDVPDESVKNTIIHELLHSCKDCMNHKREWKKQADVVYRKLGYKIKRTTSYEEKGLDESVMVPQRGYKYVFRCQGCGAEVKRMRRSKFTENHTSYKCKRCGGKFIEITHFNMV